MTDIGGIAGEQLQSFIERIESLHEQRKELADDLANVFSELRGAGFDAKIARQIIKLRALGKEDRQEQEHLLDLYKAALGMD